MKPTLEYEYPVRLIRAIYLYTIVKYQKVIFLTFLSMNYLVRSPLYLCLPILYGQGEAECKKMLIVCVPVWGWRAKDTGKQTQKGSLRHRCLSAVLCRPLKSSQLQIHTATA